MCAALVCAAVLAAAAASAKPGFDSDPWRGEARAPLLEGTAPDIVSLLVEERIFVERIVLEGLRHVEPDRIVAHALLDEGRSYSELELAASVDRIRRLPFVHDASFSLRKGSQHGRHELVVTIEEARRVFFGIDLVHTDYADALRFEPGDLLDRATHPSFVVGARSFVGSYGTAWVAGSDEGGTIGFEQGQVFGRPLTLRAVYGASWGSCLGGDGLCRAGLYGGSIDPTFSSWVAAREERILVGASWELSAQDLLVFDLSREEQAEGVRGGLRSGPFLPYEDLVETRFDVSWRQDTTDDPLFATHGARWVASLGVHRLEADFDQLAYGTRFASRSVRVGALAGRFWPVGPRHTLSATVSVAVARSEVDDVPVFDESTEIWRPLAGDYDSLESSVAVGLRVRLTDLGPLRFTGSPMRDVYWETAVRYGVDEPGLALHGTRFAQVDVSTGLAWRTPWGVVRVGLRYLDIEGPW